MKPYRGEPMVMRDEQREEAALNSAVERLQGLLTRRSEPRDVARVIAEYGAEMHRTRFTLGIYQRAKPPVGADEVEYPELESALLALGAHMALRRLDQLRRLLGDYGDYRGRIAFRAGQTGRRTGRVQPPPIPQEPLQKHKTPVVHVDDVGGSSRKDVHG